MNSFGGDWTENKIEIIVEYARAYLSIMNIHAKKYDWKLLYFDGFAGSGFIQKGKKEDQKLIVGAARRVLEIEDPMPFDTFYFVEKDNTNSTHLLENTKLKFPNKEVYVVNEDCNIKIKSMSDFLSSKGRKYKTLAYIDPCGMQLNWDSLETLQRLSVDVWVLVPTGMGVNRLLTRDRSNISDAWVSKLEVFLGMGRDEILSYFYKDKVVSTLFGDETITSKEENAIEKSAVLYQERLGKLFKFVSNPYVLKNAANSVMFHFYMASNNKNAVNIANDIVKKYNKVN